MHGPWGAVGGFAFRKKPPPSLPLKKGEGLKNLEPRKFLISKAILLPPLFKGRVGVGLLGKCR